MKSFYFQKFEEKMNHSLNLHPQILKIFKTFPSKIEDISHVIFYGPSGSGKYTLALKLINMYSSVGLKYEKKISKENYVLKISDIHYEVDMALLGCTSKNLWNEIFINIVDSILVKKEKIAFILCKNFHEISNELLDVFYSYTIDINNKVLHGVSIRYILITEQLSFLPYCILNSFNVVNVALPKKAAISRCFNVKAPVSIKDNLLALNQPKISSSFLCDKILKYIKTKDIKICKLRDYIYDLLIYNVNVFQAVWYIFSNLEMQNVRKCLKDIYIFFHYFNNNYRPIFHLELIFIKFHFGIKQ